MAVFSHDPFTNLDTLTRSLLGPLASTGLFTDGSSRTPRFMPLDLYRQGDRYILTADLPGMDPGSIDVDFDDGTLTVAAQRSAVTTAGDGSGGSDGASGSADDVTDAGAVQTDWLINERFSGAYRRQISVGDSIDPAGITADYDNGVLTVTLPLAEGAASRRIAVQHGSDRKEISA